MVPGYTMSQDLLSVSTNEEIFPINISATGENENCDIVMPRSTNALQSSVFRDGYDCNISEKCFCSQTAECTCICSPNMETLVSQNKIFLLPLEMWMSILAYLSGKDLCEMALVCTKMKSLATHHLAWANRANKIKKYKIFNNICNESETFFLNIPRFSKLSSLDLPGCLLLHNQYVFILKEIADSDTIKYVNLNHTDTQAIPLPQLGQALQKLKGISLKGLHPPNHLTYKNWITQFFREITSSTTLQDLKISHSYIPIVASLGPAIARLVKMDLTGTCFTSYVDEGKMPFEDVLFHMGLSPTLKHVNLSEVNLMQVPPHLFVPGLVHLHSINLSNASVNEDQATEIIKGIGLSKSIKEVTLTNVNLRKVPDEVFGIGFCNLEKVHLSKTYLDTTQIIAILGNLTAAVDVNLSGLNLSKVPTDMLANCINSKSQKVNLQDTHLQPEQIDTVWRELLKCKCLREINLSCNNMSHIPITYLENNVLRHLGAMSGLKMIFLTHAQVTQESAALMLSHLLVMPTLLRFDLDSDFQSRITNKRRPFRNKKGQTSCSECKKSVRSQNNLSMKCVLLDEAIKHIRHNELNGLHVSSHLIATLFRHLSSFNHFLCICKKADHSRTKDFCVICMCGPMRCIGEKEFCMNFAGFDLSSVPTSYLTWLTKVEKLNLANTNLNTHQISHILNAILHGNKSSGNKRTLNLTGLNLSRLSSDLLVKSLSALGKVDLTRTQLTKEQVAVVSLILPPNLTPQQLNMWTSLAQKS